MSTDCRKPKLTRIPAHNQLRHHNRELYQMQHHCRPHLRFVNQILRLSASDFPSRLCIISRPAFLATSFTLLLRSIASQRNSLHACIANPPPPTTFYQQHINLLSSDIGVLGSPKIRLGYIGGDTKGSSWYRTTRHQQQSNLPYSGSYTFFLRTSSTCTTINWAYFRKLGVSGQRPSHSLSLAGTGLVGNIRRCHRRRR